MLGNAKPNEIRISRIYDAPLKLVWGAWTDPAQVAKWWGPRGFSLTTHSKDLRPGGSWRYTMHGPDGTDYPNITYYHEVIEEQRLVYDHGATETTPPLFRVIAEFSEVRGRTHLELSFALASAEAAAEMKKHITRAGGYATWDRLGEYLGETNDGKDRFLINRSFEAPRETLFDMWAKPEHLANWLPPVGFTMEFLRAEIKPGGESFYVMTDGTHRMYGKAKYLKIEAPYRLVYTQQFADEQGNAVRPAFAPTWPETMLTTVTFTEEGPNLTRVTVQWEPHGVVNEAERETFRTGRSGMTQGWTGSFDKLEALLATRAR